MKRFMKAVIACAGVFTAACDVHGISDPGSLSAIVVSPNPQSLAINGTQQFTAVGTDFSGVNLNITPVWTVVSGGGSITSSGLFTASTTVGTYTNTVMATSGGKSATATVVVTVGPLATITVTPTPMSLVIGSTQQYVAVGKDAGGNVIPITPAWNVVAGGGTINSTGMFTAGTVVGTFANTVQASSGGIVGTATVTETAGPLASITVTPNPITLNGGATQQYTAVGKDASGNVVALVPVWSVAAGGGTISAAGLFTAGTLPGTFTNTVKATSGAISGTATVTVNAGPLATITVTPNPATVPINGTQQFTAVGTDAAGNIIPIVPNWSVGAGGGSINLNTGLFTAGSTSGTFTNTVRASVGTITGSATVIVTPGPLASITVTPNPVSLLVGGTQQFTATGRDAGGNAIAITPTWSVSAGGGVITGTGLYTAGPTPGTYTITAQAGGISGTAIANVAAGSLATITVSPNPATMAINATQQFTAVGTDALGNVVPITPVWSIGAGGGSIGISSGLFTAGTVAGVYANTVRASVGAITGTATVTVTPGPLASITVTPNPVSLLVGGTQQFTAIGRDAGGNAVAIAPTWSVSAGGGVITGTGLYTAGPTPGTYTITAQSGGISGTAIANVSAGPLATITVSPNPVTLAINATQQFTAVGTDALGNVVPITPVWSIGAGGGSIGIASGLFTAGTVAGVYANTVRASVGAITGTATVTVIPGPLATITVSPNPVTLLTATTQQFTATGADAGGNAVAIAPVWSVFPVGTPGGVITPGGLFTAGVPGNYPNIIHANVGAILGTATVTVTAAPLVLTTITVTPNPATMATNSTQQFAAVGRDQNGAVIAFTPVWSVNPLVGGGVINAATGVFTSGNVAGTYTNTVRATSGLVTGTATVVETSPFVPVVSLGGAALNGIMAGTAVSCATDGTINANVSISPGSTISGPCIITGTLHLNPDPIAIQDQIDLNNAMVVLNGLNCNGHIVSTLGGSTKFAGVYCSPASTMDITGVLVLDGQGNPNAEWVFQVGTGLTTAGDIVLINQAQAKNVYFVVGSTATIGTASHIQGNLLAGASINMFANATLLGRALAHTGAVTLTTGNFITLP